MAMLELPLLLGFVGQLVTPEVSYRNLEGPLFGTRVGIYHSESIEEGWAELGSSITQSSYKMILYETPVGAAEFSAEPDESLIVTVPSQVNKAVRRVLDPCSASQVRCHRVRAVNLEGECRGQRASRHEGACSYDFPLEAVPEDQQLPEERVEDDPDAEPEDSDDEEFDPNPLEWQPSAQQLRDLKIAHDNSGHPSNADFARLIRRGNGRPEVAAWVRRHFSCEECEASRQPKARRPTAVPKTFRFNHVVGIDLVEIKNLVADKEWWINCICWGTGFQLTGRVPSQVKEAQEVWRAFVHTWVRIFGVPEVVVCDPGMEFQ